jgi:hypothetical protein
VLEAVEPVVEFMGDRPEMLALLLVVQPLVSHLELLQVLRQIQDQVLEVQDRVLVLEVQEDQEL